MSLLCIAAAGMTLSLPLADFTLAWTHSIEKIRWEEDYRVTPSGLVIEAARIRGSGAGMEIPTGAQLRDGAWHYRPALAPLARLKLTRSPFVPDYQLCTAGECKALGTFLGAARAAEVIELAPCPAG